MAKAVFDELAKPEPKNGFTIGNARQLRGGTVDVDHAHKLERVLRRRRDTGARPRPRVKSTMGVMSLSLAITAASLGFRIVRVPALLP